MLPRFPWVRAATDENGLHFAQVRQTAAEIVAYFSAMNFTPEPSNDVMTFRGTMGRSRGQAAFLSFCTFLSLASLAIVLTIQVSQCFVRSQPSLIHLPTRRLFGRMTHPLASVSAGRGRVAKLAVVVHHARVSACGSLLLAHCVQGGHCSGFLRPLPGSQRGNMRDKHANSTPVNEIRE